MTEYLKSCTQKQLYKKNKQIMNAIKRSIKLIKLLQEYQVNLDDLSFLIQPGFNDVLQVLEDNKKGLESLEVVMRLKLYDINNDNADYWEQIAGVCQELFEQ